MLVRFQPNPLLTIEQDCATTQEAVAFLGRAQEIFGEPCGKCGSTQIGYRHRTAQSYDFHEAVCLADGCGARLSFGTAQQTKELFPKRKDKQGNWLPDKGWVVWQGRAQNQGEDPTF